jgi:hypothetical protein
VHAVEVDDQSEQLEVEPLDRELGPSGWSALLQNPPARR